MTVTKANHRTFLRDLKLFKNLDDKELEIVSKCLKVRELPAKEVVFEKFTKEQILYIVRYGKLRIEPIGGDIIIVEKGDFFGEIGLINTNYRTGTVTAIEPSMLFYLSGSDMINETKISPRIALKIIIELGRKITSYFITALNSSTQSLLDAGENETVEFKSTLRFNLFTGKFDKDVEHASLKTIAAFLNTAGGTLLIGVDDKKNCIGLGQDKFKSEDQMFLHLTKLIEDNMGMTHMQSVSAIFDEIGDSKVLRVDVKPGEIPAYLNYKGIEIFYIRSGPSTAQLKVSELYEYLNKRFYSHIK